MDETEKIWFNGELVDWHDAKIHVGCHGLHYGSGVFEGIRAYETERGPAVFRLTDHMRRLETSAKLIYMALPYSVDELVGATHDVVAANGLPACYLRPIAFYGYGTLGVPPRENPVYVAIMSWPWGAYLGADALEKGIRLKVSTWRRVGPNTIPHAGEGHRRLPQLDARGDRGEPSRLRRGDSPDGGRLRRRRLGREPLRRQERRHLHPDLAASILPGITRDSIVQIAQDLGHEVVEKPIIRTDLYAADELFMTGTAAEVTPIRSSTTSRSAIAGRSPPRSSGRISRPLAAGTGAGSTGSSTRGSA
jgi:branched-chain amino acid aminotransferase